ncbi:hypothetical protein [Streptomyces sp. NPDC058955]|uniref:hypothetical protein n=1 Tax=unclassified Streptomyces TaxID=2593676 RepID=UPI0036484C20
MPDATAEPVRHRNWLDEWVTVRCRACGREDQWPHPELGCGCGAVLRIPVAPPGEDEERRAETGSAAPGPDAGPERGPETWPASGPDGGPEAWPVSGPDGGPEEGYGSERHRPVPYGPDDSAGTGPAADPALPLAAPDEDAGGGRRRPVAPVSDWFGNPPRSFAERYPEHVPLPPSAPRPAAARGAFRPVTIRTARDAVAAAATYLHWLGFRDIVQPEDRHSAGVDLRGAGLVAQVDPSTRPAGLRAVECLWLNGLSASAVSVFFSLAGYTPEARSRAAEIGLPLFVLDLTGTPQPVNNAADELTSGGAI